jgi:glycosyltransferase involved in cell wall biosynthesis
MILGIDASNIRAGGGLTHLIGLLTSIKGNELGFGQVIIWASSKTLNKLPDYDWLIKKSHPIIEKSSITTLFWQVFYFSRSAQKNGCSLAFAPGGTFLSGFRPFVTMSQNMLPFELKEAFRFKGILTRLRFLTLHYTQSISFNKASGLIFLTNYARDIISAKLSIPASKTTLIPHGINPLFLNKPVIQREINSYSFEKPFRLLYVSIITAYKHQWNVAAVVAKLRQLGYPVVLDLVGPKSKEGFELLNKVISTNDPEGKFLFYHGAVDHDRLNQYYKNADAFVFASSCENMPIILIEAMSSGLPIACSDRGPMPEVLKENGFYFNPEDIESIKEALISLIENPQLRYVKAINAFEEVGLYTWEDCANKTFSYLAKVAREYRKK